MSSRITKSVTAHEAIVAIIGDMPPPGTVWKPSARAKWLNAFKAVCDLIYEDEPQPQTGLPRTTDQASNGELK